MFRIMTNIRRLSLLTFATTIAVCLHLVTSSELPEPDFASPLQNVTIVAGREARIACMVENLQEFKVAFVHYGSAGSAVLTVGTHVLTTNRRVSVLAERNTWTLVIANSTIEDRGDYMCQISTVPAKKMYGSLAVQVPPHISNPPDEVTIDENENVTLKCEATGDPHPRITWRREDGTQLFADGTTEFVSGTLSLASISRNDSGAYLCVASNGVPPAVSARVQIFVNFAPRMMDRNSSEIWAASGTNVNIPCKFTGYPKPNISWIDLQDVSTESSEFEVHTEYSRHDKGISRLYFRPITREQFGKYQCLVANSEGEAQSFFILSEKITTTTTATTATTISTSTVASEPQGMKSNQEGLEDNTLSHLFNNYFMSPQKENDSSKQISGELTADSSGGTKQVGGNADEPPNKRDETNPPNRYIQENPLSEIVDHQYSQGKSNSVSYFPLETSEHLLTSALVVATHYLRFFSC